MRLLKFPPYQYAAKKEPPPGARAWIILYQSVSNYPSGNKEQTATIVQVLEALKGAARVLPPDPERPMPEDVLEVRVLKDAGADVYLEDAEWRLCERAVEKFREFVRGASADALLFLDGLLEKAPSISRQKLARGETPAIRKVEG